MSGVGMYSRLDASLAPDRPTWVQSQALHIIPGPFQEWLLNNTGCGPHTINKTTDQGEFVGVKGLLYFQAANLVQPMSLYMVPAILPEVTNDHRPKE